MIIINVFIITIDSDLKAKMMDRNIKFELV